jgi:hypothetical protein
MLKASVLVVATFVPLGLLGDISRFGGQLAVLGLTLGIFFGTVSLSRPKKT